jgi:4-amino-4-deoxy-L-arabinose transferase-like glycosyltransferase
VLYRVVRRWAGVTPGLLAAGIFAFTPIVASMFGHSMEDGALTMCLVLAADSWQRAVMDARLRSLVWSGVWVAIGFQAKMLQAWMVVPAFGLGYLLSAPVPLRRRLWHLGVTGSVTLAASLSWVVLYSVTPATSRPYLDGTTNNSAITMVFGYDGLERFGVRVPGAISSGPGLLVGGTGGDPHHWVKLLGGQFLPEIGWLYPLVLLALAAGLLERRRAGRTDPILAGWVMWGGWLATFGFVYSEMNSLPHTAYVASLAPPIAALSGAGIVMFWRWYRAGERRGWIMPLAVAAELAWAVHFWSPYPGFVPWARWPVIIVGTFGVIVLAGAWPSQRALRPQLAAAELSAQAHTGVRTRTRLAVAGLLAGVAAMLAAPVTWAASVLDVAYAGTSFDATAGPVGTASAGTASAGTASAGTNSAGGGVLASATTDLTSGQRRVYGYVSTHREGASYLLAVASWSAASPYIMATGQEVLSVGGFSGAVPEPTLARVRQLVLSGQLRFFLIVSGGPGLGRGATGAGAQQQQIDHWVEAACVRVPAKDYGGSSAASAAGGVRSRGSAGGTGGSVALYACGKGS